MAGLARRRPLRSRKVWSATEKGSRPTTGTDGNPGGWRQLREACSARAGGRCQAGIPDVCTGRGHHAHHLLRRGQGGPDELDNLAWLCSNCHGYVHERVEWSYRIGLLRRRRSFAPPVWTPDDHLNAHDTWASRGFPDVWPPEDDDG